MLARVARLKKADLLQASARCASSGGKNVAQGDTLVPSSAKESGNATKGSELAKAENLEYVTIQTGAQAFKGDLRSTSGLGLGDGLYTHTSKWDQVLALAKPGMPQCEATSNMAAQRLTRLLA